MASGIVGAGLPSERPKRSKAQLMGAYCIRHAGAHAGRESPERAPEGPIGPRGLRHPHRAYSTYGTHTGTYRYHKGTRRHPTTHHHGTMVHRTYEDYSTTAPTYYYRWC